MGNKKKSRPVAIDVYAGVGGMSLGAARAGFDLAAAVELDPIAIETHAVNFPRAKHLPWDVATTTGEKLLETAGVKFGELDGLIGGPPCQGFSEIGRRARHDPRNALFGHFFRLVAETQPRFFVAENVPGLLDERNRDCVHEALSLVPENYKLLTVTEVAAHRFGAATTRARVFFVGYDTQRMNPLSEDAIFRGSESEFTTVGKALEGLPKVRSDWQTQSQGWRVADRLPEDTPFRKKLTNAIPIGVGCPNAIERLRRSNEISGNLGTRHAEEVVQRFMALKPGTTDKVSRAPRLTKDGFCPTLRAGTAADKGSFQAVRPIHYGAPRVITPREAARLQGFPDWFQFHATKWHSFRQIGNSVSPLVAEGLLSRIRSKLQ